MCVGGGNSPTLVCKTSKKKAVVGSRFAPHVLLLNQILLLTPGNGSKPKILELGAGGPSAVGKSSLGLESQFSFGLSLFRYCFLSGVLFSLQRKDKEGTIVEGRLV